MVNDLSTPLTGRKRRTKKPGGRFHFPLARVLFLLIGLILGAAIMRIVLVEDPNGGRPSQEVAITSTRDANAVATSVQSRPATITADPQQFPVGAAGNPVPATPTSGTSQATNRFGTLP